MQKSNKKLTILYILEILKQYSDENHPLTQGDIIKKLRSVYDVEAERKSIGMTIDSLIDFGYDIVKLGKGGCYLADRKFESSEITFLIDAVFTSKNISSRHAKDLAKKLSEFQSIHKQRQYKYIHKADEVNRTPNYNIFLNIEIINEAIDKSKKIGFKYNVLSSVNKLKPKNNRYIINPYFMLNSNGKYYLVCSYEGFLNVVHYRIDYITDIQLLDDSITPVTAIKGYEKGIDIAKYANDHVNMWSGETIAITLKMQEEWAVSNLIEWFGNTHIIEKQENGKTVYYADVKTTENGMLYWAVQFGDSVEVIKPESVRQKVAEHIERIADKYRI